MALSHVAVALLVCECVSWERMSLSVLALGVALLVVPRRYAVLSVSAWAGGVLGFVAVFSVPSVGAGAAGALAVLAVSALVVGVLVLCEGLFVGLSVAPGEFYVTAS